MFIWLLIGYMWLFIHRPFEVWPVLGEYRLELLYVLATMAVWLFQPKQWPSSPVQWGLVGFGAAVLMCWLASPWCIEASLTVENYFKVFVFYVLVVTTVGTERDLRRIC